MMARQHVTFGVGTYLTGIATASYFSTGVAEWVQDRPLEVAMSVIMVAGGCLVPDADHHNSTIIKKMGWLGALIHNILKGMGVKHRGILHSFFFALLCGLLFLVLGVVSGMIPAVEQWLPWVLLVPILFFTAVTFNFIFGRTGRNPAFLIVVGIAYAFGISQGLIDLTGWWLPLAAMIGPLLHDVGDMLTKSKFPFWAPFSKKKVGAIVGFKTNTPFETVVLRWAFFAWSFAMIAWVVLMATDMLVRTDFSVAFAVWGDYPSFWGNVGGVLGELAHAFPYLLWTISV